MFLSKEINSKKKNIGFVSSRGGALAFNPISWETGFCMSLKLAWSTYQIPGQAV